MKSFLTTIAAILVFAVVIGLAALGWLLKHPLVLILIVVFLVVAAWPSGSRGEDESN